MDAQTIGLIDAFQMVNEGARNPFSCASCFVLRHVCYGRAPDGSCQTCEGKKDECSFLKSVHDWLALADSPDPETKRRAHAMRKRQFAEAKLRAKADEAAQVEYHHRKLTGKDGRVKGEHLRSKKKPGKKLG